MCRCRPVPGLVDTGFHSWTTAAAAEVLAAAETASWALSKHAVGRGDGVEGTGQAAERTMFDACLDYTSYRQRTSGRGEERYRRGERLPTLGTESELISVDEDVSWSSGSDGGRQRTEWSMRQARDFVAFLGLPERLQRRLRDAEPTYILFFTLYSRTDRAGPVSICWTLSK